MRLSHLSLIALLGAATPALAEEAAPAAKPAVEAPKTTPAVKSTKKASLMDINTATADELKTLPGMTDELSQKIIAGRPFKGKDQLLKQNIVDKAEYAKIRSLIVAKQPKVNKTATRKSVVR